MFVNMKDSVKLAQLNITERIADAVSALLEQQPDSVEVRQETQDLQHLRQYIADERRQTKHEYQKLAEVNRK